MDCTKAFILGALIALIINIIVLWRVPAVRLFMFTGKHLVPSRLGESGGVWREVVTSRRVFGLFDLVRHLKP